MVLEQFLDRKIVMRHFSFLFFLGLLYVFVAFIAQELFFGGESVATVLLLTILLVPSMHHLAIVEEKIERSGTSHFFKRHRTIVRCYIGAFFGMLAGFIILGTLFPGSLAYQTIQLEHEHMAFNALENFKGYYPSPKIAFALFTHNLQYLLIGLLLALFYGAGATFLAAYNASFFAAFVLQVISRFSAPGLAAVSLSHLFFESAGFIVTAVAGMTLSRAILVEKYSSAQFRNVIRNCFLLIVLGILLIFAAAFIETYFTAVIFHSVLA